MRYTCAGCENLIKLPGFGNSHIFGCDKTGFVVPHSADFQKNEVIFWRIPIYCPLPDSEVRKSEKLAAKKHWVKVSPAEIKGEGDKP